MKMICRKSGQACGQCMKGLIPDIAKCPNLIRMADDEHEGTLLAEEEPDSIL